MQKNVEVLEIKEGLTLSQRMWKRIVISLTPILEEDEPETKLLLVLLESYSWDVTHLHKSLLLCDELINFAFLFRRCHCPPLMTYKHTLSLCLCRDSVKRQRKGMLMLFVSIFLDALCFFILYCFSDFYVFN